MWASVVGVTGTRGVHCVRTLGYGHITTANFSDQPGVEHCLLPAVADVADLPVNDEATDITIVPGRWYAVYWQPTHYWYIGQVLHPHDPEAADKWTFSFLEQTKPSANAFKPIKDIESVHRDHVFLEVAAPAPSSSTRTSLLKLTRADFNTVQEKFKDF